MSEWTKEQAQKEMMDLKIKLELLTNQIGGKEGHKGHESIDELLSCPNCYPKIRDGVVTKDKGIAEALKLASEKEIRDKKPYVCDTCGTGVDLIEPNCPTCKGKYLHPRK